MNINQKLLNNQNLRQGLLNNQQNNLLNNNMVINNDGSISNKESINNNLPTDNLIDNIHNESIITMSTKLPGQDFINKPSFSMKDLSVGSDRKKLKSNGSIDNVNGYDGEKDLFNFDNVQSPYDIINTNTIKSILQNVNSNTFMMYEDDNYQDNYFELGVNNNENVSSNEKPKKQILNVPSELKKDNKIFHLLGVAFNEYYNQYYVVYENVIKTNADNNYVEDNLNNMKTQVAEYILAKIKDKDSIEIVHEIGPRNKINNNDVVYFAYGNFQLGPLMVRFI